MDNRTLITEIKSGNRVAFDLMCGRYYAPLMAYARLFLDGEWAEDIVQDVLVNVWMKRENLDEDQPIYGYLLRSTYNTAINYINKHRHNRAFRSWYQERIDNSSLSMLDSDNNPIIRNLYSEDMRKNIFEAIERLPRKCREVFKMNYVQGMSQKEISQELGISLSTVENHVYLALKQLRAMIDKNSLVEK